MIIETAPDDFVIFAIDFVITKGARIHHFVVCEGEGPAMTPKLVKTIMGWG